jgi:cytochrome c553
MAKGGIMEGRARLRARSSTDDGGNVFTSALAKCTACHSCSSTGRR